MKISKFGHCCLLIEIDSLRILTDPGNLSVVQNKVTNIDIVLITHEHADHLHTDSLKQVLENNPKAQVITNSGVGKMLDELNLPYSLLQNRETREISGVLLEAFDCKHEEIFEEFGQVQNTGYFIGNKLFYPGDAFCDPEKKVEVLALPVAGPWCKIGDAIRYALNIKPNVAFPVHDGVLRKEGIGIFHTIVGKILEQKGVHFIPLAEGDSNEL